MYLVNYEESTGRVKGFYQEGVSIEIPYPVLPVTDSQHKDYFEKGQRHVVQKQEDGTRAFVYVPPAEPTAEEIKQQKVYDLDAEYQPQFSDLVQSVGLATLDGNQTMIDGIKSDYAALKAEYQTKREAIVNG